MDHGQLSLVADKFQWVFSEALLNACGKDVKFCRRQRILTPFRLGLELTATCASQRVETIADLHCGFNALFGTTITYKAFYNQVAKPHFADFARTGFPIVSAKFCTLAHIALFDKHLACLEKRGIDATPGEGLPETPPRREMALILPSHKTTSYQGVSSRDRGERCLQ